PYAAALERLDDGVQDVGDQEPDEERVQDIREVVAETEDAGGERDERDDPAAPAARGSRRRLVAHASAAPDSRAARGSSRNFTLAGGPSSRALSWRISPSNENASSNE